MKPKFFLLVIVIAVLFGGYGAFILMGSTPDMRYAVSDIDTARAADEVHDHDDTDVGDHEAEADADPADEGDGHDHEAEDESAGAGLVYNDNLRAEYGIEVSEATAGDIETHVAFPGEIVLNQDRSVVIVPQIEGIVREVRVTLGTKVRAGDVLAVIESRELAEAAAAFCAWRERLDLAQLVYDREVALQKKDISSEQEVLDARIALSEARIEYSAARKGLLALGLTDADLAGDALCSDLAARYEIRAPLTGIIIDRDIARGDVVAGDRHVFVVADMSDVWVDFQVSPPDIASMPEGGQVTVTALEGGKAASADILYVGKTIDPQKRTALLRARLATPDGVWLPGAYVTGSVVTEHVAVPVLIPADAVQLVEGLPVVFVDTPEGFVTRDVSVGRHSGKNVEITDGLTAGEKYVSRGAFNLKARVVTSSLGAHAGHGH